MKASRFTDAQKAFIVKQGEEGELCPKVGDGVIRRLVEVA